MLTPQLVSLAIGSKSLGHRHREREDQERLTISEGATLSQQESLLGAARTKVSEKIQRGIEM
jgi:hypothetical protein